MTNSRQCVKSRPITLKKDYVKMCLEKTKKIEELKRHIRSLEDNLQDANQWADECREAMINQTEKRHRVDVIVIAVFYLIGFFAGMGLVMLIGAF